MPRRSDTSAGVALSAIVVSLHDLELGVWIGERMMVVCPGIPGDRATALLKSVP